MDASIIELKQKNHEISNQRSLKVPFCEFQKYHFKSLLKIDNSRHNLEHRFILVREKA